MKLLGGGRQLKRTQKFLGAVTSALAALVLLAQPQTSTPQTSSGSDGAAATQSAVIDRYCVTCHNSRVSTQATASGVVLDRADLNHVADNAALWERVVRKLRTGAMPPDGAPRPDRTTHDSLVGFIESRLDSDAMDHPNPGR